MESAKAGNLDAMRPIFDKYAGPLYSAVIMPKLGDPAAAEDVLRDTMSTAIQKLDQFTFTGSSIFPWLRQIAINKAYDVHRQHQRGRPQLHARPTRAARGRGVLVLHGHLLREVSRRPRADGFTGPWRGMGGSEVARLTGRPHPAPTDRSGRGDQGPGTSSGSKTWKRCSGSIVDPGTGGRPRVRVTRLVRSPTRIGWAPE